MSGANLQARALFAIGPRDMGCPLQDLEVSYRPIELRSLIDEARAAQRPVGSRSMEWTTDGKPAILDVSVLPLASATGANLGCCITFTDVTHFARLQQDVQQSKLELETAYEELQSTVEELETTNEELQSTNEELETTNEELQSTNEELETVNEELRERTAETDHANGFLEAVLGALRATVVVVDQDMRVRLWNDRAADTWGLRAEEVRGQHLMNLDIGLPVERLRSAIRSGLAGDGQPQELTVEAMNRRGRTQPYHVTCTPVRANDGRGRGALLVVEEAAEREP